MLTVFISSPEPAGKTTLCAGLGDWLLSQGKKPGFLKPVLASADAEVKVEAEKDAQFIKQVLHLGEGLESLCPVLPAPEAEQGAGEDEFAQMLRAAHSAVSAGGKDVVLVEGPAGLPADRTRQAEISSRMTDILGARVILLLQYSATSLPERVAAAISENRRRPAAVVVNMVPVRRMEQTREALAPVAEKARPGAISLLPEERRLFAPSVGQIADLLGGKVLNNADELEAVAENVMVGAMNPDPGRLYFERKDNKVAVVRQERPDMQLAALETSLRGLVVSGGKAPIPQVSQQAETKGVPIVVAEQNTLEIMEAIEKALKTSRFRQLRRMEVLRELLRQHLDCQALLG